MEIIFAPIFTDFKNFRSVKDDQELAINHSGTLDLTVVTGSFFTLADAL
ncbi:MAG: hypothetical protein AB8B53_05490 [Flavobacteriales bacterium]